MKPNMFGVTDTNEIRDTACSWWKNTKTHMIAKVVMSTCVRLCQG